MRCLPVALCAAAFIFALPLSNTVSAMPIDRVAICHVSSANDVIDLGGGLVRVFGKVITVAGPAVPVHLAHGDSLDVQFLDEEMRDALEEQFGISLPNADCYVPLP